MKARDFDKESDEGQDISKYLDGSKARRSKQEQKRVGGKERKSMKKKIKYTNEPMGKVRVVTDFLPSPEELALKDETVKVTISISKASVDFFKKGGQEKSHTVPENDQKTS